MREGFYYASAFYYASGTLLCVRDLIACRGFYNASGVSLRVGSGMVLFLRVGWCIIITCRKITSLTALKICPPTKPVSYI